MATAAVVNEKETYYAIYGLECEQYLDSEEFFSAEDAEGAKQFETMGDALAYINGESGLGDIEIQRVTVETIEGTATRRILGLNELAPKDAIIKFCAYNSYFGTDNNKDAACNFAVGAPIYTKYGMDVSKAPLYDTEREAGAVIIKDNNHGIVVRRVAITSTKPEVKITTTTVE